MKIQHVGLVVSDLERSRRFYADALGLVEVPRPANFAFDGAWFRFGGTELHLLSDAHATGGAGQPDPGAGAERGMTHHLAFAVDDLDAACARLAKNGVALAGGPMPRGTATCRSSSLIPTATFWSCSSTRARISVTRPPVRRSRDRSRARRRLRAGTFEQHPLVRRVCVAVGKREAGEHRRDLASRKRRRDRQRSADPHDERRRPNTPSNASRATASTSVSRGRTAGGVRSRLEISSLAPTGSASRRSCSAASAITAGSWPGATRIVIPADARETSVVFRRPGLPPRIPVTSTDGSTKTRR